MASQLVVEEASKEKPLNNSSADEQVTPKKRERKRRMEEEKGEKKRSASSLDRPSRERKSVERYAALSPIRVPATKALAIQQGSGEKLKDIPNVAFKLSKRKADENLRVLHRILFGRKGNVHFLKRNILQFSGFVWSQNEEKDRLKVKEKLNKCNKDRLLDLSDLLDIYTLKATTKKEDISARLMEFLESPHVTREVILFDTVKKGKKRKRGVQGTGERALEASPDKEKKRKRRGGKKPAKDDKEDKDKGGSIDKGNESADENESADAEETSENYMSEAEDGENEDESELAKKLSDEEGMNEHEELESKQHSPAVRKVSRATSKKLPSSSKKKVDNESKSMVSSESKAGISKDSKRSSIMSPTSKKGLSPSKKKVVTEGKIKVHSKSKASMSKDSKPSSNNIVTSMEGLASSKKKVDTEDEPEVPSESKADFSKDTKGSLKMKKDKVPRKTDSKDNSTKKVSMKGEAGSSPGLSDTSKKADRIKEKNNAGTASKDMTGSKKKGAKMDSNNAEKQHEKKKDASVEPTTEQLSAVISEILKEVDFNVATLADIIRKLGAHFDTDVMHRKTEIKRILEEVINDMTDDEDDGDGDGDDEGERN